MAAHILIVDDNPNNLRLLITLLQGEGYEVRPASNGPRALAMARKDPPELVLLDINMPELDGYEVCKRLKADALTGDIPVLFISANDEPLDKVRGFEAGGVDYLSKPYDPHELHARVRTHLELKRSRDQLREMNTRLQDANAMLQGLNEIKDEFLSMVSHDLKNPLSSILLFSRYMESRSLSDDKAHEIGRLITRAGRRMFRLIEDLLDLNRFEQGQLQLETEVLELPPLLAEIAAEFAQKAADKQQRILLAPGPDKALIRADGQRLRQVLENLISNALKFSPPGSEVRLRLYRHDEGHDAGHDASHGAGRDLSHDGRLIVDVEDQGPGLSPEDQARLFQKFVRLSARPSGDEHSSGLGLYIARQLIEAMQGTITCRSPLGSEGGACFSISLPAAAHEPIETSEPLAT